MLLLFFHRNFPITTQKAVQQVSNHAYWQICWRYMHSITCIPFFKKQSSWVSAVLIESKAMQSFVFRYVCSNLFIKWIFWNSVKFQWNIWHNSTLSCLKLSWFYIYHHILFLFKAQICKTIKNNHTIT